jgi:hypothetical protein
MPTAISYRRKRLDCDPTASLLVKHPSSLPVYPVLSACDAIPTRSILMNYYHARSLVRYKSTYADASSPTNSSVQASRSLETTDWTHHRHQASRVSPLGTARPCHRRTCTNRRRRPRHWGGTLSAWRSQCSVRRPQLHLCVSRWLDSIRIASSADIWVNEKVNIPTSS